jgi:2,4-dienoyl-CoA reductase-like NADH-dependent reductase (Old Yellow Enzyme family)
MINNMNANYQSLFEPFGCKSLNLKNRIVMPAMTRKQSPRGLPSQSVVEYYSRRAADVGLILSEGTVIERPSSKNYRDIPNFFGEALNGWKKVIDAVHRLDGVMGPQLWHVGVTKSDPSGWLPPAHFEGPENMSLNDIQAAIRGFAQAALSAKALGFDCLEVHAAHGYLIDQFFWDHTNPRKDEYGGTTLKERIRFAVDVVTAIRKAVGPDFTLIMRLSQWKVQDYHAKLASTPSEMESWLNPLAAAGVDIFHCSQRRYWEPEFEGSDLNFAGWAKKISGRPTITVGSVGLSGEFLEAMFQGHASKTTGFAELVRRLDRGDFDLVAVGRAILQDPHWARKIKDGRIDEIKDFDAESLSVFY